MKPSELLSKAEGVKDLCADLLTNANEFALSKEPKVRALGYEICTAIASITAATNQVLQDLTELKQELSNFAIE